MQTINFSMEEIRHLRQEALVRLQIGENILKDPDSESLGVNLPRVRRRVNLHKRILKKLNKALEEMK